MKEKANLLKLLLNLLLSLPLNLPLNLLNLKPQPATKDKQLELALKVPLLPLLPLLLKQLQSSFPMEALNSKLPAANLAQETMKKMSQ
jgi:hypothetical protein